MTSEQESATIGAGAAARASWPPLRRERCFRTAFSWLMVGARGSSSRRVIACLSASVIGGTGAGVRAEPPTGDQAEDEVVEGQPPRRSARISPRPPRPARPGRDAPHSTIRTPGGPEPRRSFTATRPSRGTSGRTAPTPSAIVSDALPAPTTRTRRTSSRSNVRSPIRRRTPVPPERLTGEAACVPGGDPGVEDPPGRAPERGEVSHARSARRAGRARTGSRSGLPARRKALEPLARVQEHVVRLRKAEADLRAPELRVRVERRARHRGHAHLLDEVHGEGRVVRQAVALEEVRAFREDVVRALRLERAEPRLVELAAQKIAPGLVARPGASRSRSPAG